VHAIFQGCVWTLLGTCASQLGTILALVIAARLLNQGSFGAFGAVQATAVSLSNIAAAGLGISATRYLAETCHSDPARAGRLAGLISLIALLTATLTASSLALFPYAASALVFGHAESGALLRLAAIHVFFGTLGGYQAGALLGLRAYRALNTASLAQALCGPILMYLFTSSFGLHGSIVALALSAAFGWAVQFSVLHAHYRRAGIRPSYIGIHHEWRAVTRFALPAALSGIVGNIAIWGSTALVVRSSEGLALFGQYTAANSVRSLVLFAPAIVNRVATPLFAQLHSLSPERFRESFWSNLQLSAAIAAFLATVLIVFRNPALSLFGSAFGNSRFVVILCIAALLEVLATAFYQLLISRGAMWSHAAVGATWSAVLLSTTAVLTGRFGAYAIAYAFCAAWFVSAAAYGLLAVHAMRKRPLAVNRHSVLEDAFPVESPS
jgi:O-antigen/teichoic acid export membrane protein